MAFSPAISPPGQPMGAEPLNSRKRQDHDGQERDVSVLQPQASLGNNYFPSETARAHGHVDRFRPFISPDKQDSYQVCEGPEMEETLLPRHSGVPCLLHFHELVLDYEDVAVHE